MIFVYKRYFILTFLFYDTILSNEAFLHLLINSCIIEFQKILKKIIILAIDTSNMAEAGIEIFIATAVCLGMTIAIYFGERSYRYKRIKEGKPAGTYGMTFEGEGHP